MNEKQAAQDPRFTRALNQGFKVLRPVFEKRSRQYGDTMEECRWLTMLSAADAIGIKLEPWQARILFLAGQDDMKYWRQLGGFKFDSLLDRLAYCGALIGELDTAGLIYGSQQTTGTQAEDHDAHDRVDGLGRAFAALQGAGSSGGLQRANRDAELAGTVRPPCTPAPGS